jgi:hypothetical protein
MPQEQGLRMRIVIEITWILGTFSGEVSAKQSTNPAPDGCHICVRIHNKYFTLFPLHIQKNQKNPPSNSR